LKLAFVVQRYGLDIAGGAEYHCRLIAEHMARHAQVEVLTTCAADYITWADHYPEGLETLNGIPVRRFRVKRPRDACASRSCRPACCRTMEHMHREPSRHRLFRSRPPAR